MGFCPKPIVPTETTEGVTNETPDQTAPEQAASDDKEAAKYRRRLT